MYYRTPIVPEVPAVRHSGTFVNWPFRNGKKRGDFRTKNVLQMTFFSHSGMPRNQRFQNTRFQHILEPLPLTSSGMTNIFAFQNVKHRAWTEHKSFLKHQHFDILEPSFFTLFGAAFLKPDFRSILEHKKICHSRTPNSIHIPECPEKRLWRTIFLPNVLKGMFMRVFWKGMLLGIPEWSS